MINPYTLRNNAREAIHGVDSGINNNAQTTLETNNPPKQENEQHWLVRGLATIGNFVSNIVEGAVKSIEGIVDAGAMLVGLFGADVDDFVSYDFTADIFGTDEEGNLLPVIYVYKSKLLIQPYGQEYQVMADASVTVEFISGEYVYYTTSEGIFRKSYFNPTADAVQITDKTNIQAGTADFDGRFIYFYAQTESDMNSTDNYYLYRANTKSAELGRMKTECIADVVPEDLEENETEESGDEFIS